MSQRFLDAGLMVGYDFEEGKKDLVVTLKPKMAQKMKADGWDVQHEAELGYFVKISLEEVE